MKKSILGYFQIFLQTFKMIRYVNERRLNFLFYIILSLYPKFLLNKKLSLGVKKSLEILSKNIILTVKGIHYILPPNNISLLTLDPLFDRNTFNYLKLNKGDVFLDIGAHIGRYSLEMAKKAGLVIALEPCPENFKLLKKNIELNKARNIVALNFAAWSKNCNLKLFFGFSPTTSSVKRNMGLGFIKIKAKKVDYLLEKFRIKKVDWIKIDTEGAEVEVLKSLTKTLEYHHPKLIVEVGNQNLKKVRKFFKRRGYKIRIIEKWCDGTNLYCKPGKI